MVGYNPKDWSTLIFHTYSKEVFRRLFPSMLGIGAFTAAVCWVELEWMDEPVNLSNAVHSLLGFVLSLFLVFRTNTAYDRWWEGRRKWGDLVNVSRTFANRVHAAVDSPEDRAAFAEGIASFPEALRDRLRGGTVHPSLIARDLGVRASHLARSGRLNLEEFRQFEECLRTCIDVQGACERILKTPIPYSYSMFMKKFIFMYIVTLPLGFVGTFAWWTVAVVMAVFYVLVSIELIAEEIENPFGTDDNDLPLDELCAVIRRDVALLLPVEPAATPAASPGIEPGSSV